jgi:hypothetical protein
MGMQYFASQDKPADGRIFDGMDGKAERMNGILDRINSTHGIGKGPVYSFRPDGHEKAE